MNRENWNEVDTVFLDLDGTLLDLYFDNYFWRHYLPEYIAQQRGWTVEQTKAHLVPLLKAQEGKLQWYCVDYWSQELAIDIAELKKDVAHLIKLRPSVLDFLEHLRVYGKKIILATNAHAKSLTLKFTHTALDQWLDDIVSSHDYGHPKENLQFWQTLHAKKNFDPQRTLFIDDNLAVLRSAQTYGIRYLLCVTTPDSSLPATLQNEFIGVDDFQEIM